MNVALLGTRYYREIIAALIFILGVLFILFCGVPQEDFPFTDMLQVSSMVQRYEGIILKYAKEQRIEDQVPILMAIMQQESGGRGGDPMQSSESQGHPPGYFHDPEVSIKYGVRHFKKVFLKAKGDLKLAVQGYNFGTSFVDYVLKKGGKYSLALAQEYSAKTSKELGWGCSYWQTSPYCYGDVHYVDNVFRYFQANAIAVNQYGFIQPLKFIKLTSSFGYRFDPFSGASSFHKGADLSCDGKALPVYSVKSGTVTRAGWQDPSNPRVGYGQRVYVDHGNGQVTVYGHLSQINVRKGQHIGQGQPIGRSGSTGSSTGMHLHFEIQLKGIPVNPIPYINRR